ncbi:MAG: ABC transporter [Proteobacteria bacterium]|nr:MAG: ABC transporter [Pseudomonadota bacterium]
MFRQTGLQCLIVVLLLVTQSACSTLSKDVTGSTAKVGTASVESKGWERVNRSIYGFNKGLDTVIVKPLARGYRAVTPAIVDRGITNFFGNLSDVKTSVNALLQLKGRSALTSAGRVVVNSTVGLGGLMDVASKMNMKKYNEDFGQTLAHWGVKSGPYVMLPIVGPSTLRDAAGLVVDGFLDPALYSKYPGELTAVKLIDKRADLLSSEKALSDLSSDMYSATRDVWLQRRAYQLQDGKVGAASKSQQDEMIDLLEELEDE